MVVLVGQRHQQRRVPVADVPRLVGLHRVEHRRQQVVAVRGGLGRHRDEQRVGERRLGHDRQVDARRGDRVTGDEALGELPADGAAVVVLEVAQAGVEAGRVDVVVHVQALEVLLDRRVPDLVDHLDGLAVVQLRVGHGAEQQRHRPRGRDLGQRDDGQEQLLPLQPALLHLAEHVAADRAVRGAVHPVVLLLLHREVGPQDLLERVLLLRLLEGVVGPVLRDRLVVRRFPGQLLDLLVGLRHALATHGHSSSLAVRRCNASHRTRCRLRSHIESGAGSPNTAARISLRWRLTFSPTWRCPFGGRLDAERAQQLGGGRAGIAATQRRMQSLLRQVLEDQIDDAPRVVRLARRLHRPESTPARAVWGLNLRQAVSAGRVVCQQDVTERSGSIPAGALRGVRLHDTRGPPMPPGLTHPRETTDGARLAKTREQFLTAEAVDPNEVRDAILASWWRSRRWNVAADHLGLPYAARPGPRHAPDPQCATRAAAPARASRRPADQHHPHRPGRSRARPGWTADAQPRRATSTG